VFHFHLFTFLHSLTFFLFLTGKTNNRLKLYGRIMRHIDPVLCGIGGMGFYLYFRFSNSNEMSPPPDFTTNKAWFDIKLLTDGSKEGNCKEMSNESFSKGIQSVLDNLGITSKHYLHLGRVLGPISLEKMEIESRDIQQLRNKLGIRQNYPCDQSGQLQGFKMPVACITTHGQLWTVVEPPVSLQRMIFPFADRCLEEVREKSKEHQRRGYGDYGLIITVGYYPIFS
jgi:hypothetical protein